MSTIRMMYKLTNLYSIKIKEAQNGIDYAIFKKGERYSSICYVYKFSTQAEIRITLPGFLSISSKDKAEKLIFGKLYI